MSTQATTIEYILEKMSALQTVTYRKMFGEYALYFDGKVIALVCDDMLYIKITEPGKKFVGEYYQEGFPYPGAKPAILIDEKLEDTEWLCKLVKITPDSLPVPKPKKAKKK